jgi:hypothetical protein
VTTDGIPNIGKNTRYYCYCKKIKSKVYRLCSFFDEREIWVRDLIWDARRIGDINLFDLVEILKHSYTITTSFSDSTNKNLVQWEMIK